MGTLKDVPDFEIIKDVTPLAHVDPRPHWATIQKYPFKPLIPQDVCAIK